MCGADTQYSLPSVDVSKERVSYEFSMGVPLPGPSAETLGPGPANYDPTPVDVFKKRMGCGVVFKERFGKEPLKKSLTEDAYCRYEGMAPVPPSETGTKFGSEIQRPDLTNKNTNPTLKCYASHKPGTPSTSFPPDLFELASDVAMVGAPPSDVVASQIFQMHPDPGPVVNVGNKKRLYF